MSTQDLPRLATKLHMILKRIAWYRPPALIVLLGGGETGLIVSQLVIDPAPLSLQAFEVGVPLLLVAPVFYTASMVNRSQRAEERQLWITVLSILFAIIAAGTVALILISELARGGRFEDLLFPPLVSSAAGLGVGSLAGLSYDDIRATQQDLNEEVRQTQRLNQRLTVMNRIMRHNVRNQLSEALGYLERVLTRLDDVGVVADLRTCRESLESLHSSAEKALLVDPLWQGTTEMVDMDLEPIIESVVERQRKDFPGATITTEIPPSVTVRAHPLLPTAIEEAIENALLHNDPTDLSVEIDVRRGPDGVIVEIVDDGGGIPENEINALDDGGETPHDHASGVGIWLIKWVVETSNGQCTFQSPARGGTAIRVLLPAA